MYVTKVVALLVINSCKMNKLYRRAYWLSNFKLEYILAYIEVTFIEYSDTDHKMKVSVH